MRGIPSHAPFLTASQFSVLSTNYMHILFLSAWFPYPTDNGIKLRSYHLLRGLAATHEVDLLCFSEQPPTPAALAQLQTFLPVVDVVPETAFAARAVGGVIGLLSPQPRSLVANHSATMEQRVRTRTTTQRYDLVIAEDLHMVPYALAAGTTPKLFEGLEILRIYDQYRHAPNLRARLRYGLTWFKTYNYVKGVLPQFAGVTCVSEPEQALFKRPARRPAIGIVPNGVDIAGLQGNFGPPEADTLIYAGSISYDANFDAVAYYLADIYPYVVRSNPHAKLRVTGKATPTQIAALPQRNGVEFTGFLDDVRPAVARAWAEVVPLRTGSGTRLKILEALALGTPVISTSKGVEGLNLQNERDLLVADTAPGFAAYVVQLLVSNELRQRLVAHGQRAVEPYDWGYSVRRLAQVVEEATRYAHHKNS